MENTNSKNSTKVFKKTYKKSHQKKKRIKNYDYNKDFKPLTKWEKTIKKICFDPPNEEFYSNYVIKPGFSIWRSLTQCGKSLEKLDVKIPDSFIVLGNNNFFYLYYDPVKKGIFSKTELDVTVNDFENNVAKKIDCRFKEKDFYFFVQRRKGGFDNELSKKLFTKNGWKNNKNSTIDSPSMLQEYIYSKSNKASISRICYKTKNYDGVESSFGYKITNNLEYHFPDHKITAAKKSTLCKDEKNSFDVVSLNGRAIEKFSEPSEKFVKFLEKKYQIHISEIVIDYITNIKNENILFNVKSIRIKKSNYFIKKIIQKKKQNLNELSCSVYCKLCGLLFKKDEASKILTYKLLWEFCKHLKKRGVELKDIDFNHSSTRPCRVCDLCFMAVVSEHELVELEQKFALMQNIPIKDLFLKVPVEKPPKNRPALLKKNLKQWRLMVFIKEIQFKKGQKEIFKSLQDDFYLRIQISSIKTVFKIKLPKIKNESDFINFPIKILRMFYFFSESLNIKEFLQETQIDINFTRKEDSNIICHGSSRTINKFRNNLDKGQKHESLVYLFFKNAEIASLKIIVGLVNDGIHNTVSMNLFKYNSIYFPDDDFYNCNIFPIEWIEIFEDGENQKETKNKKITEAKKMIGINNYTPFCTENELKKMLNGHIGQQKPKKRVFSNISNLYSESTIQSKKDLSKFNSNKKVQFRMTSAHPNLLKNVKNHKSSAFVIKKKKKRKPFSSHNPKSFKKKMQSWFSAKLKEEDNLYNEYLMNLGKTIEQQENENTEENELINKYLNKSKVEI